MKKRIVAHIAVSVLVGPPLAGVVFLITTGLLRFGPVVLDHIGPTFGLAITPYSWLIAFIPALIAGAVNGAAVLVLPRPSPRLLLAPVVGAIVFALCLNWLAQEGANGLSGGDVLTAIAVAGAVASLICVALVESFGGAPGST